jgi:hypothetical protein
MWRPVSVSTLVHWMLAGAKPAPDVNACIVFRCPDVCGPGYVPVAVHDGRGSRRPGYSSRPLSDRQVSAVRDLAAVVGSSRLAIHRLAVGPSAL